MTDRQRSQIICMADEPPYLGQNCVTPYPRRDVILRILWNVVQSTLFRWSPRPWHWFRAWLLRLFGADIQHVSRVVIFPTVRVALPWNLRLADRAMIGPGVRLYNLGTISVGRGANISQYCHLCAGTHDYAAWSMPLVTRPIILEENCWLGTEVFVGPGVTVGELAVVGARSVVVRDLPPRKICVGHPCRAVKDRLPPRKG